MKPPASPSLDPAVEIGRLSKKTPSHSSRQGLEEMLRAKPARSEEVSSLKAKVAELEAALSVEKRVNESLRQSLKSGKSDKEELKRVKRENDKLHSIIKKYRDEHLQLKNSILENLKRANNAGPR